MSSLSSDLTSCYHGPGRGDTVGNKTGSSPSQKPVRKQLHHKVTGAVIRETQVGQVTCTQGIGENFLEEVTFKLRREE